MGCRSTVCLPLVVDDNVAALIVLFAAGWGFFDEDELALLNELAADVSFALDDLDKTTRLDYLAYYDSLIGVPNRSPFRNRLELALAHARRRSEVLGVILINLDRFKKISPTPTAPRKASNWCCAKTRSPTTSSRRAGRMGV
ncbi:MAG: diguanylate cyclase [Betaproteobacteria bacterium]|nr:diguanylate cyclase [Betaproteobacteria bacterium]